MGSIVKGVFKSIFATIDSQITWLLT